MKEFRSDISGFYKLTIKERQKLLSELVDLNQDDLEILNTFGYFQPAQIDTLIENVVGSYQLPLGLAFNFKINDQDFIIPMVIEEPSVVAAASNAAKMARKHGGFHSDEVKPIMISQIQITQLNDIEVAKESLKRSKELLLKIANEQDPVLNKLGGGAAYAGKIAAYLAQTHIVVYLDRTKFINLSYNQRDQEVEDVMVWSPVLIYRSNPDKRNNGRDEALLLSRQYGYCYFIKS